MGKEKINRMYIIHLAASLAASKSESESGIEKDLFEKYGVDLDNFSAIVQALYDRLDFSLDNDGVATVSFGRVTGIWTIYKDITRKFQQAVVKFASNYEGYDSFRSVGKKQIIVENGLPKYKLVITDPDFEVRIKMPE